ncbi:glycosyltransferase family 4 protein [Halorubrum sp. SY-15]|uniref:glycosyltransferase family 4 protein n=1 Tax=Halorubrum sp. SY-15 TaxID=3402277 RepID=UPI003EBF74D4
MGANICYVVNSVSPTSVPATIATALVDYENIAVDILAWFEGGSFEGDGRVGLTVLDAPRSGIGLDRQTYREARNVLREYDLIQANLNHAGSLAKVIGYRLGIPLVSREGNTRDGFTRKGRMANGLTNALVDRIVPNSQAVYNSFTRWERLLINDNHVQIIPNGVDLERIDRAGRSDYRLRGQFGIPSDAVVVGTAAMITEQKAHDILVQAVDRANTRFDSHRIDLVVAGDGPLRSEIETLAVSLGIDDRVHFTGLVDRKRVYEILSEIDIYAMPSRWEGFSNAAVEALGAGKPCVFSDIDPFLIPYEDVALFHTLDDSRELGARLAELAADSDLREQYGQRGRKLVEEQYTLEQVAAAYAELYAELL